MYAHGFNVITVCFPDDDFVVNGASSACNPLPIHSLAATLVFFSDASFTLKVLSHREISLI